MATGRFPDGKLNDDDEGELLIAIVKEKGNVRIEFSTQVKWIAFSPDMAIQLAQAMVKEACKISGQIVTIKIGEQ